MPFDSKLTLVDRKGRKYLTADERQRFLHAARQAEHPEVQTLALMLTYTGCRISEALELRMCDIDLNRSVVNIQSLKRRSEVWREVPIPSEFARELELTHQLRRHQVAARTRITRLWNFSRSTAYRKITGLMAAANVSGTQASPKGLRHAFGIAAVEAGVPLPTIAAVLGHSSITTTAIYTTAVGKEARELLQRMW
ncbi:MAG: tyrosine-type recombinase/integrase [Acidiferrobacterales bacterium]|nr:tyrosine-type recombinase/integrase [Acidiferrobacterales bacterium]